MSAVAGQTPDKKGNNVLVVDDFALSVVNAAVSHNDLLKAGFMSACVRALRAHARAAPTRVAAATAPCHCACTRFAGADARTRSRAPAPPVAVELQPSARWRPRSSWRTA